MSDPEGRGWDMRGNPRHPGESLWEDWIAPLGLSVVAAAEQLGVEPDALQAVCDGRSAITPDLAVRIDRAFGGGDDTWLALQSAHSLAQARESISAVQRFRPDSVAEAAD